MAAQNWKAGIGSDTHVHELDERVVIVSVHMSNDEAKFIKQKNTLAELIKSYPNKYVVVTGDFNAQLKLDLQEGQRLYFHSKDIDPLKLDATHTKLRPDIAETPDEYKDKKSGKTKAKFHGYMVLPGRTIILGVPLAPTTNKVRMITTQLSKILKPVAATIDWCFVVAPAGADTTRVGIESSVIAAEKKDSKINEIEVGFDDFAPASWCSDHFMLKTVVTIEGVSYQVGSLNILGESVDADVGNHFEFADQEAYREIVNQGLKDKIVGIYSKEDKKYHGGMVNEFLDLFVADLKNPESPDKAILDKVYEKFFATPTLTIARESITPESVIGQKVFGLVNAKFMNLHYMDATAQDFANAEDLARMNAARDKYKATRDKFFASTDDVTKYLCNRLQNGFFQKLYADAAIRKVLVDLFARQRTKLDFKECLDHFLESKTFDAFALQEVGSGRMLNELADRHIPGYCVQMDVSGDTTTGAVVVKLKEGIFELAKCVVKRPRVQMLLLAVAVVLALVFMFGISLASVAKKANKFADDLVQSFQESMKSFQDL
jgi:hypothetical protein